MDTERFKAKHLLSAFVNMNSSSTTFRTRMGEHAEFWPLAARCIEAMAQARKAANLHPLVAEDGYRCRDMARLNNTGMRARHANILERCAVQTLIAQLETRGLDPLVTINDEVVFAKAPSDCAALEEELRAGVRHTLGFEMPIRIQKC